MNAERVKHVKHSSLMPERSFPVIMLNVERVKHGSLLPERSFPVIMLNVERWTGEAWLAHARTSLSGDNVECWMLNVERWTVKHGSLLPERSFPVITLNVERGTGEAWFAHARTSLSGDSIE